MQVLGKPFITTWVNEYYNIEAHHVTTVTIQSL